MSRKQFIESQGATCKNWTWSWSFINEAQKTTIFGAWDIHDEGNRTLILSEDWEVSRRGQKQPGYSQSREHIRLIEEEGYHLKTFPMEYVAADENDEGAPSKIKSFTPELYDRTLVRLGNSWYASDQVVTPRIPEEVNPVETFFEGNTRSVLVNEFERSSSARRACISHHGYKCIVCDFDFEKVYGDIGRTYIHVHHIVPISELGKEYEIDPIKDLLPICPNCHAMIHSTSPAMSVEQLRQIFYRDGERT